MLSNADFASASSSDTWIRTYEGSTKNDRAESFIQCTDGGYAVAGTTNIFDPARSQLWLLKTDALGNMEWNQTFGSVGLAFEGSAIQTSDGGYAIAGTVSRKAEFIKIDSAGNTQWEKTFENRTWAACLIQTRDGKYALAGSIGGNLPTGGGTIWFAKFDQNDTLTSKTYPNLSGAVTSIIQTNDGGYAMLGNTEMNRIFCLSK